MTPTIAVRALPLRRFAEVPTRRDPLCTCLLPTAIFAPKNCAPLFGHVETRLKMTFHSPTENKRATRRLRKPLSKTPLSFFHYENVFRKKGKTISIQTHRNWITSSKRPSLMPILPNPSNPNTTINPKQASNPMPHLWAAIRQNLRFPQKEKPFLYKPTLI